MEQPRIIIEGEELVELSNIMDELPGKYFLPLWKFFQKVQLNKLEPVEPEHSEN